MNSLMIHPNPRQKYVLQGVALITLGVLFVPLWNVVKKTHVSDIQVSSVARVSDPVSSLFNNLYLFLLISFLAVLLGVTCAFYFREWLPTTNWIRRLVENQVSILSGVPSLLYGILAVSIFLPYSGVFRTIETSLSAGNVDTAPLKTTAFQGDTTLFYATVLTFVLLVMPRVIKTTEEALRSVPIPIRESAYALGASRWQVLMKHVVPIAFPWVLAGGCRTMSCAFAITALFIGICIWGHAPQSEQMSCEFVLFLGVALLLSVFSSLLIEKYPPVPTQDA